MHAYKNKALCMSCSINFSKICHDITLGFYYIFCISFKDVRVFSTGFLCRHFDMAIHGSIFAAEMRLQTLRLFARREF